VTRPQRIVVGALAALLAVAGAAATLVGLGVLPSPFGPPAPLIGADGRRVKRFYLEHVGPKAVRVTLEGRSLGELKVDADGNVSGQALYNLPVYARTLIHFDLPIERAPEVDASMARYVKAFLAQRGANGARVIEPGQSTELPPPPPR
jgi:hypothetical protein